MASADDRSRRPSKQDRKRTDPGAVEWFYRQEGKTYGPMTSLDLRAAARLGFLCPGDDVLCRGQDAWVPAGSIHWLFRPRAKPS